MTPFERLKPSIFATESGGDYNALYNYANRAGNPFAGFNLTGMTVDEALEFASPSGPYAQYVKGQVGRVATPMGAYQVVGSTLAEAKKGLGLTGSEMMTEDLQDKIGQWIYKTQGPSAWEGLKGKDMATPMDMAREEELRLQMLASGTAPQAAPRAPLSALMQDRPQAAAAPQQRRSGFGGIMDYLGEQSPTTGLSRAEQFAAALDPLIMPEMRAGEAIRARGAQRQAAAKRNKTIEYLEKYSPEAADLMRGGLLNASEALKISRDTEARSLAKRASEALQSGDMQTAMAILTQLSPTAMGQQIAAQAVKPPSEILGGGKYTVTYPEGRSGEPVITINEDVVAAEQRIAQAEREARREATGLPTDARKAEEADFEAITAIDNLMQDISGIIGDFGYDPATKEFTGPLDIGLSGFLKGAFGSIGVGGQGAIETAKARDEFERFKTRLVNTSLRLNKGVQTEGDAQRAAKELGDARTEATAYAAIQELLRINQRARDNRSAAIARRRERFKLDPVEVPEGTAPDLKWSIK